MEGKQKPINNTTPMAMAELEIMKAENAKSVADKSPEIRSIALLLLAVLGVSLLSQISSYVIVASFNNAQTNFFSALVSSNGVFGITALLVQVTAILMLLFTRNISHAKAIILVAGISFGVSLVSSIASFDIGAAIMTNIATLAVNFLIFRKILKAYLEL